MRQTGLSGPGLWKHRRESSPEKCSLPKLKTWAFEQVRFQGAFESLRPSTIKSALSSAPPDWCAWSDRRVLRFLLTQLSQRSAIIFVTSMKATFVIGNLGRPLAVMSEPRSAACLQMLRTVNEARSALPCLRIRNHLAHVPTVGMNASCCLVTKLSISASLHQVGRDRGRTRRSPLRRRCVQTG